VSNSSNLPLHLYQALEQEYVSLHGPIPAGEAITVELPYEEHKSRFVTAKLDWQFHAGHIKDPLAFAASLLPPVEAQAQALLSSKDAQPYDWMRENLKTYLRGKISDQTLGDLIDWQQREGAASVPPRERVEPLERELNAVLDDPNLYHSDRFSDTWLSSASRGLIYLYSADGGRFQGQDLAHFNRLLLEDAFRESLEKIHNIRLAAIYQRLHEAKQKALCLSGGGIRSGTFALGLLQGMARHHLLKHFDYLSTVSGGGYIGSWLTAWIHRHPDGLEGVNDEIANSDPKSKIDPDPQPIRHLREYSSFITPKVGLLSADTWTFANIYCRNLFLNLLVFIPLLIAMLTVPRLILTITLIQPIEPYNPPADIFDQISNFFYYRGRDVFLWLGFAFGVWALAYIIFNRPSVREQLRRRSRFWRDRTTQRSFLLYCLLPLVGASACLTTYWAWSREGFKTTDLGEFLLFGVAFTVLGWLIASLILRRILNPRNWKDINLYELVALVVAGLVGGISLWVMSLLHNIDNPIIGYGDYKGTGGMFPWTDWVAAPVWSWTTEWYVCFAVPVFMMVFLMGITLFVGVSSISRRIDDEDREWWARLGAWVLTAIVVWGVSNTLVIFGPIALLNSPSLLASAGGLSGLLAILLGRSAKTSAGEKPIDEQSSAKGGVMAALTVYLLPLLGLIFIAAFVAALSLATTSIIQGVALLIERLPRSGLAEWLTNVPEPGFESYLTYIHPHFSHPVDPAIGAKVVHMNVLHHTSTWFVLGLGLLLFAFGMGLARVINLNLFSLHAGYRNRLIRAFLGASRPPGERKPNPFTGFDPADNIHMHELRPALLDESDIIDPERLAAALQDDNHPLSRYLAEKELLENLKALPPSTASPRLTASLRKDLNGVLEDESLYTHPFAQPFLQTKRALRIQEAVKAERAVPSLSRDFLRSDYHLLLNRLVLEQAYPNMIQPCRYPPPPYKMMHIINTTLNLVGGKNLAWQQRKAEPFSVSPLHSGCFRLGYRNSRDYGGRETSGISIGTACAISGAAASSNMGYYTTSPVLSLLLTLFNVRLGWWLGNPGPAGDETYYLRAPKYSVAPVIDEAFGLTDDVNKYVYLTDGGHFENLAIYEMVLRRCHIIVVSDGAQDAEYHFSDLGNAVRKIRIDLGVPIEFTNVPIYKESPPTEKGKGMYWAIGKIRYSCIDRGPNVRDGVLLYIKPAVYGDEPRDVLEYKESHPAFPHQSTADQFFDEPQFESYRMLGSYIMDRLCGEKTDDLDLYEVIDRAYSQLTDHTTEVAAADPQLEEWLKDWLSERD
jgi:hypothetical protein